MTLKNITCKTHLHTIFTIVVLLILTGFSKSVWSQAVGDYKTKTTGTWNWNTVANWQRCVTVGTWTGATSTTYPGQNTGTGTVTILNNTNVTLNVSPANSIGALTINNGNANSSVTLGTFTLSITGAATINANTNLVAKSIIVGTGILNVGSLSFTSGNGTKVAQLTLSTGTVNCAGNIAFSGTAANALFTFTGAGTLNIGGSLGNGGTFLASTGTVNYNANGAQTIGNYIYNNLTLSGSVIKTEGTATINGILSMEGTATISSVPTYGANSTLQYQGSALQTTGAEFPATFGGTGGVIINNLNGVNLGGTKTITNVLNLSSGALTIGANTLTLNGTTTLGTGTITGGATSSLSIGGSNTPAMVLPNITGGLQNLTLNKTGTNNSVSLGGNLSIGGLLILTSGVLQLVDNNLTITNNAANAVAGTFSSSAMIATDGTGYLIKNAASLQTLYPIGGGGFYSPATLSITAGGTTGTVSARAVSTFTLGVNFIYKYWDVITSVSGKTITATFSYDALEGNPATSACFKTGAGAWQIPPPTGTVSLSANSFTITGTTSFGTTSTFWTARAPQTYYSYKTGSWTDPTTWTSDPGGTTQAGTTIPANNDIVIILTGRAVTLSANVATTLLDVTIEEGGVIDLLTYQFLAGLKSLSGQGTLKISSNVFPTPITLNTFINVGGGTTEYNTGINLPAQGTYNNLSINVPAQTVIQINDLVLNGDLRVKQGTFQINDATSRRLKLSINGNVTVDAGATIKVGTGVTNSVTSPLSITGGTAPFINYYDQQSHRIVINGNFTNNGTVRFTNLTYPVYKSFPPTSVGATSGFATVYFQGATDNKLFCNGTTDFYNLVLDKGIDQTFKLTIYSSASAYSNFRLFGANIAGGDGGTANPNLKKALWIRTGTLVLEGLVVIPSLTEGANAVETPAASPNSDFYIPSNGALVLNGIDVIVQSTADDYREVNAAYATTAPSNAAMGISTGGTGSSLGLYGKLKVDKGYLTTKESSGIITNNISPGQFELNDGTIDTKQFLSLSGAGSFEQNGGLFLLRGRFQRTPSSYASVSNLVNAPLNTVRANDASLTGTAGTFNLNNAGNVFVMSGGTMKIYDVCGTAAPTYAFQVNSSTSNINITGGTIEFIPTLGTGGTADAPIHLVSTTSSLGNVTVNRVSGVSKIQLNTPLTVLNNLTLISGVLTADNQDVTIGGGFSIASGTTYTPGSNTTKLYGSGNQTFTVNLATALTLNKFTIDKPAGAAVTFGGSQKTINVADNFRLALGTLNDNGNTINVAKDVYNSGLHSGIGKITLNGTVTQVIDGNGIFQNLELNNTNAAAAPVSLAANTTINGVLTFSQNKLFNIDINNLMLNASATIVNGGALRYIQSSGKSGDGGVTKVYSTTTGFTFPIGAQSTRHAGIPNYTPATIGFGTAPTTYGSVTVVPVGYAHPASTISGQSLTYFWRVKSSGFVGATAMTHSFTYSQNDVVGTEANYIPTLYNRNNYTWVNGTNANPPINTGSNTFTDWSTPGSSLGYLDADYTVGDNAFGVTKKYWSRASAAWSVSSTWSTDPVLMHTGAAATSSPGANDIVIIGNGNTVNLTANANCASLQIQAGAILDIYTWSTAASNFSMVLNHPSGNGLIRLTTTVTGASVPKLFTFPSGDFSVFNNNGGTTEFYDIDGAVGALYILPANVTSYGNLIVTAKGGDNLVFPNNSLTTINGDLTCSGDNANAWIAISWNTNTAPYNSLVSSPTIEKTIYVKGNLNVNTGTLIFMPEIVPQHVIVDGNVIVGNNAWIDTQPSIYGTPGGPPVSNTFAIGGNLINNSAGFVRFLNATYYCDVTFQGGNNALLTGTSPSTIFNKVFLNKGSSQATTLTCNIAGTLSTPVDNWLTLQNGTFQYTRSNPNTDFTISTVTPFNIPATAGLLVNMPNNTGNKNILIANSASNTNDLFLDGKLTVINGNVYIGPNNVTTNNNNDIEYSSNGASEIEVQGGSLVVNGQIRQNPSTASGILKYTQSGGTVTINGQAANSINAKLEVLNNGSAFNMSAGILNIIRGGGGNTYGDLFIRPENSVVTGGDIVFAHNLSGSSQQYLLDANVPLNNITISGRTAATAANAAVKLMVNPLVLNGNLTLSNANSIFDANSAFNINVSIKGDFTNNGAYNHYNNLTTFNAGASNNSGIQSLLGSSATDFYNLSVLPVTKLILNKDITVNNDISLSDGTLESTSNKVNVKGNVSNNANYTNTTTVGGMILNGTGLQHISGTGTFGLLNLNNTIGAAIENDITLQSDLVMTNGILDINTHLLTLGQSSNITLAGAPFSSSKMITSDGVWSNIGILKVFGVIGSTTTFTYPLGVLGKYTPAILTINSNNVIGSIRVNSINRDHPAVLDPTNVLNYYWEVESVGISGFTGNILLNYLPGDVIGGPESTYIAAQLLTPGTNWSKATTGPATDNVNETNHSITFNYNNSSNITGEYTAGNDPAIPNTVPQYTSIANGNWTDNTKWVPSGGTTFPCPVGGPNGFIVTIDHEITADANYCFSYRTTINNKLKINVSTYGHNFGTVYGNGTLYLESAVFPAGRFNTFLDCSGNATLEYGGTGTYNINADLYSSAPNITFSGSGSRQFPNKDLTVCKQLLLNGPALDNNGYNRHLTIQGTMLRSAGSFISGSGSLATVTFAGSAPQTLENFTGTNAFNNLEINNSFGLTLTGSVDVTNNLLLTNGLISTTAANKLTITNYSTTCVVPIGGSSISYIDGPLTKTLNQGDPSFKFPIGKKGYGLGNKLTLRATQSGTLLWTAEYFNPNSTYTTYAPPLTAINTKEYWTISGVPGGSAAFVQLDWDPVSDLTPLMTQNGLSDMRVSQHNGTDWAEVASSTVAGSGFYNGSIETSNRATLTSGTGNFTLGCINSPKPRIRLTPSAPICGVDAIPVTLTSSITIVSSITVNYTENGVAKSITPASFPAYIPTIAGGATYRLTGFTYNYPAGIPQTGVFDASPVISYPSPTPATVGTSISICGGSSVTNLTGNNPAVGSGLWTVVSGTGGSLANPTQYNSGFTGTNGSGYTLRWTISSGTCKSTADLSINFPLLPVKPAAFTTSSAVVCQGLSGMAYVVTLDPTASSYTWSYTGSGATINGTTNSVTVDFSSTASSGTLSAAVNNGCGTSAPLNLAITINPQVWTGTVSTNWNIAGNWSCGILPNLNSNVQIPNVSNKPVLSGGVIGAVNNITINSGSSVTITGNTIQIAGTITNNGTFTATSGTIEMKGGAAQSIGTNVFAGNTISGLKVSNVAGVTLLGPLNVSGIVNVQNGNLISSGNLTLLSTASQTALIDGTGTGSVTGNVTMQRYLPSGFGYKYVSSPFKAATVNELADDINLGASFPTLYKYDEDNHRDSSGISIYTTGWANYLTTSNLLTPMQGYAANFGNVAAAKTFNITGVVNDILTPLACYNHNRQYTKGFNLAGNPYPSPIDWNASAGWTKTNIDNALYFFDNGTTDQYTGTYSSYVNGVSTGTGGNIIPSMQGFFIHVSNGTYPVSASLGMDNRVRVNNLSPVYHKSEMVQNQTLVRISAAFENEKIADPAVIYFDESASENFDTDLDALKLMNTDISVPNFYVVSNQTEQLSISAMPYPIDSITKIPLGIKTEQSKWVTFTANNIENLPSNLKIYFSDGATGLVQDLRFNATYRVSLQKGTFDKRFALLFSYKSLSSTLNDKNSFYANIENDKLNVFVNLPTAVESLLTISNVLGQVMMQKDLYGNGLYEIDAQLPAGIYILTLRSQQGMDSIKIYITK